MVFFRLDFCLAFEYLEVSEKNESSFSHISGIKAEKPDSLENGDQYKDLLTDSLLAYLNQQDWSYLKAENDWEWHGDIIMLFKKNGFIKRVKSDFQSGYTHKDDIRLRTADKLKRQVRKSLKQVDLSHLNPPSEYKVNIVLNYTSASREVVWSRENL